MKKDRTQWFSEKYLTIGSLKKKNKCVGICVNKFIINPTDIKEHVVYK